jgi:hypothetical protein
MSFLAPLFLLGALAVALPIVFHLIRRTSRDKVPFSSLMFLVPTPPRVTRRSRLENILLLILRCLVFCLLALGFSRPFLQRPLAANTQSQGAKRVAILVDTSASMRRENLWAAAKAKVDEALNDIKPADQVALFTFDRQFRPLVSFDEWSRLSAGDRTAVAKSRLAAVSPNWSSTHLGGALIAAADALEEAGKRDERVEVPIRQILVITDLQEGSRLESLQGYEWPRGVELVVEQVKPKRPTNAGLQLILENEESVTEGEGAVVRVRVSNSSDAKGEQFQLRFTSSAAAPAAPFDAYVPPSQSRIFKVPLPQPSPSGDKLVLTGDDQDFDNTLYFVQAKGDQVNLIYLGNEAEGDPAQPFYYLNRAFQKTRRQTVRPILRPATAPVESAELQDVPVAIIAEPLTDPQTRVFRQFLDDGKTIVLVLKSTASARTLAGLLGTENITTTEQAPRGSYAMLGEINFEHPLFSPFADPRFSDFTKIHFWKYRRLDLATVPNARTLARFDSGDPALVEVPVGQGRLLVLTSGWQPSDSQLALSSKFVPLLYSILEQSGSLREQSAQYLVGDPVQVGGPSTNTSPSFTVLAPDGSQTNAVSGRRFLQTDLPGIYTVTAGQSTQRFAVNLDPLESRTSPLAVEELERLGVQLKNRPQESAQQFEERQQKLLNSELENRQKLWRWLIVAALIVLLAETALAGWLSRRAVAPVAA